MNKARIGLVFGLALVMAVAAAPQAPKAAGYHLLKKHVLGGEGGWDYMALDGRTRLLYVTHGNAVEVLNVATGVKGEPISGLKGVHGVAFAPEKNRGYISNGRGNSVSVFNLKTRQLLTEVPSSGQNPDSVMYDAFSGRVFTFNGRTANATAIDAATDKVVGTVDIGGGPDAVRYDPGTKLVFASNGEGTLTVVRQISADKYEVAETVPTARGARTMELDPKTHHVFVVTAEYGPTPAPTAEQPRPRPAVVPGSFMVLEFGK